jgi:ABC-type multidrug transport system fused ATPase/permease subunit
MVSNPPPSSLRLLRRISGHLSHRRRLQFALLLVVMLASGLAELVSLGAVVPFLAVLSNPEQLWQLPWIKSMAQQVGYFESQQLVLPATVVFALAAVLAAVIRLMNQWLNGRLAAAVGSDLSCEAYQRTLYQPYEVHVQRNTSTVIAGMTQHVQGTVVSLRTVLQTMSSIVVSSGLLIGLLMIDWQVALSTAGLFGIAYGLVAFTLRRQLQKNGERIAEAQNQRVQAIQEGLGAIRDVLLDGSQNSYVEIYRLSDRPERLLESKNQFLSVFPRYAFEALGLVAIAMLGCFLVLERGSGADVIPLLGVLALGAQRLLPSLQQIYSGWAVLKAANPNLDAVNHMLNQLMPQRLTDSPLFTFQHGIRMQGIHFQYNPELPEVLNGLDLEIQRGERIGLIGSTGSGKSTLVDVLMGLLQPTSGRLLVDGADLHEPGCEYRLVGWRASVAHVPQSIYLADTSIAENIAFGVPKYAIDMARVKRAADQAQIAGLIESSSSGYDAFVGERGIRLSGGQRQRIGIARALYKQASVIVFDEATSALDSDTEKAVMEAVEALSRELTLIIVAHRLSTVQRCDRVIRLGKGSISADGPPQKLLSNMF